MTRVVTLREQLLESLLCEGDHTKLPILDSFFDILKKVNFI